VIELLTDVGSFACLVWATYDVLGPLKCVALWMGLRLSIAGCTGPLFDALGRSVLSQLEDVKEILEKVQERLDTTNGGTMILIQVAIAILAAIFGACWLAVALSVLRDIRQDRQK
jgi:hypothetical protein